MILATIAAATAKRVAAAKEAISLPEMQERAAALPRGDFPFTAALKRRGLAFICEVKKGSPSKGIIDADFPYLSIAKSYEAAGAEAISVLTEPDFFFGSKQILSEIRDAVSIPLLRKDFIIDPYQIYETKVIGADAILLIAALLDGATLRQALELCGDLGLSALVETHSKAEIATALGAGAAIIGVNNRDLQTFTVDLDNSLRLRPFVPPHIPFVAESGICSAGDIKKLRRGGADAVLIGETLMKSKDKATALKELKGEDDED